MGAYWECSEGNRSSASPQIRGFESRRLHRETMTSYPKCRPVRDKAWRQYVASLPCLGCGLEGSSQAAHIRGHGMGIKASDYECVPLCCARLGVRGCHAEFDATRTLPGKSRTETGFLLREKVRELAEERER